MAAAMPGIFQPLALGSFSSWTATAIRNRVDLRYLGRAIFVTLVSFVLTPLRVYERYVYRREVSEFELSPPIFIIGHWRSGTTRLQNLLSTNRNFGYVTTLQTIAPELLLTIRRTPLGRLLMPLLRLMTPTKRMMDRMRLGLDLPQEEEFAVANLTPASMYHFWSFPQRTLWYFNRYGALRNMSASALRRWKRMYDRVLRKAALDSGRRVLVVKNPVNTARIPLLLEMYPRARFVHIVRDPYDVFASTLHLYRKVLATTTFQGFDLQRSVERILVIYRALLDSYREDFKLIPETQRIDVKFEELERDPAGVIRRIYTDLNIPGFAEAEPRLQEHLADTSSYRKNTYALSEQYVRLVNRYWEPAFTEFGYRMRAPVR